MNTNRRLGVASEILQTMIRITGQIDPCEPYSEYQRGDLGPVGPVLTRRALTWADLLIETDREQMEDDNVS